MKKLLFILIPALLLAITQIASGFGSGAAGCSGDCTACHSVKKEEVQSLVNSVSQGTEVLEVKRAQVPGLYQATVRQGKDEGIVYVDFSKRFLISGRVIDAGKRKDITQEAMDDLRRVDVSAIKTDTALLLGNPAGSKKLYVFTDPECPYCAQLHEELTQLVKEEPQLLVYIILYPLDIHPDARWKTESIACTARTDMPAALEMLDRSFRKQELKKVECGSTVADAAKRQAADLGIGVTPTIVTADGRLAIGMKKKDALRKLLETAATQVGQLR